MYSQRLIDASQGDMGSRLKSKGITIVECNETMETVFIL